MFAPSGTVLETWTEAKHKDDKSNVFILCYPAVVASGVVKLSASLWFATIAGSHCSGAGGKYLGVEDMS